MCRCDYPELTAAGCLGFSIVAGPGLGRGLPLSRAAEQEQKQDPPESEQTRVLSVRASSTLEGPARRAVTPWVPR
jgi:hypothetical protein